MRKGCFKTIRGVGKAIPADNGRRKPRANSAGPKPRFFARQVRNIKPGADPPRRSAILAARGPLDAEHLPLGHQDRSLNEPGRTQRRIKLELCQKRSPFGPLARKPAIRRCGQRILGQVSALWSLAAAWSLWDILIHGIRFGRGMSRMIRQPIPAACLGGFRPETTEDSQQHRPNHNPPGCARREEHGEVSQKCVDGTKHAIFKRLPYQPTGVGFPCQ